MKLKDIEVGGFYALRDGSVARVVEIRPRDPYPHLPGSDCWGVPTIILSTGARTTCRMLIQRVDSPW